MQFRPGYKTSVVSPGFFSGDKIPWREQKDETPHFPGNTGGYIYKL